MKRSIDDLKNKLELDHSEELFGIEKPVPYQCPRIDSFIKDIDMMKDHIFRMNTLIGENENNINAKYIIRECNIIKEYQEVLVDSLEEVREACDNLRRRGEGWKDLAKKMFEEIPNNKKFIDKKYLNKI